MGFLDLEKLQEKTNYMVNIQILSPFIHYALSIYGKGRLAHFFLCNFKYFLYLSEVHNKRANNSRVSPENPVYLVKVRNSNCSHKYIHKTSLE